MEVRTMLWPRTLGRAPVLVAWADETAIFPAAQAIHYGMRKHSRFPLLQASGRYGERNGIVKQSRVKGVAYECVQ